MFDTNPILLGSTLYSYNVIVEFMKKHTPSKWLFIPFFLKEVLNEKWLSILVFFFMKPFLYYRFSWKMGVLPALTKIDQLRPGAVGIDLIVKVVNSKAIMLRGRNGNQGSNMRLAECLVGDESGIIIFTARNDQGVFLFSSIFSFYITWL